MNSFRNEPTHGAAIMQIPTQQRRGLQTCHSINEGRDQCKNRSLCGKIHSSVTQESNQSTNARATKAFYVPRMGREIASRQRQLAKKTKIGYTEHTAPTETQTLDLTKIHLCITQQNARNSKTPKTCCGSLLSTAHT